MTNTMYLGCFLFTFVPLFLQIAYFTLLERYILALYQFRTGPDLWFFGLPQPLLDGIKLFLKSTVLVYSSSIGIFIGVATVFLTIVVSIWSVLCFDGWSGYIWMDRSLLFVIVIGSLSIYCIMLAGWSSESHYGMVGSLRFMSQYLSFEVAFSMLMISYILGEKVLSVSGIWACNYGWSPSWRNLLMVYCLVLAGYIETNRVPFDLPESESELVAGFLTEYSSVLFALFFLGEYCSILVFAVLISILVMSYLLWTALVPCYLILIVLFCYGRVFLPRLRFDQSMRLCWMYLVWYAFLFLIILSIDGMLFY